MLLRFYRVLVRVLLRFYPIVLILGIALVFVALPRMAHLFKTISTDPADLLPQDYVSVQTLLEIRDKVDQKRRFGVIFESEHPESTKRLLHDLAGELRKSPSVAKVLVTKPGYDFFDKNKFLYMETPDLEEVRDRIDRQIQRKKLGGFYISFEEDNEKEELDFKDLETKYREKYNQGAEDKYFVSPNGKVFGLYVEGSIANMNLAQEKQFQEEVRRLVEAFPYQSYDFNMKVYFAGSTRIMEYRALLRDLKVAGIISGIVIFLPLLIRFRRPQYVLLIFLPLLVGVPAGIALASLWVPKLNVTTSFLFAILGGLGVETGIHIFSRYHEKRLAGVGLESTLLDIYEHVGPPALTAIAALAVTFILMVFSDFRGFSEFGFVSALGLIVVFLLYFTFFPALLILAEKIRLLRWKEKLEEIQAHFSFTDSFVKACLVLFGLWTLFSLFALPQIGFEYNSKKIRADIPEEKLAKLKQRLTTGKRANDPALVLINSEEEAKALQQAVEAIKVSKKDAKVEDTSSLYSLVPKEQARKMEILAEIEKLLSDDSIKLVPKKDQADLDRFKAELKRPEPFVLADVPKEIRENFYTKGGETLFFIFAQPQLELDNGLNAMEFGEEIAQIKTPLGTFQASSSAIVFGDVLRTMLRDSKKIMLAAVLSVGFFVFLDFKSFKKTAFVMVSILMGVLWVFGVLYLLRIKLNLYNMVMIPAVMGMSVDNSIHLYHRYEELGRGRLAEVLSTTGITVLLASLTNAAGFVGLAFASHGGLRSMGVLAVIGVVTCLMSTLLLLPAVLRWRERQVSKNLN